MESFGIYQKLNESGNSLRIVLSTNLMTFQYLLHPFEERRNQSRQNNRNLSNKHGCHIHGNQNCLGVSATASYAIANIMMKWYASLRKFYSRHTYLCLTVMEYMCHRWSRTCSAYRNYNPVRLVFDSWRITRFVISTTMDVNSREGNAYLTGTPALSV